MSDNDGLVIECGRSRNGKAKYTAKLAGKTLHVARIDVSQPTERGAFAAAVASGPWPSVGRRNGPAPPEP